MSGNLHPTSSSSDREQARSLRRDAVPGLALLLLVEGGLSFVDLDAHEHPWHLAVALLPLVPALWIAWAQQRAFRRADEYQRIRLLEAIAAGFAVAMLVAFVGGLVQTAGVDVATAALQMTFIGGIATWAVTLGLRSRVPR